MTKLSEVIILLKKTISDKSALRDKYQQYAANSPQTHSRLVYSTWAQAIDINVRELERITHDLEHNVNSLD